MTKYVLYWKKTIFLELKSLTPEVEFVLEVYGEIWSMKGNLIWSGLIMTSYFKCKFVGVFVFPVLLALYVHYVEEYTRCSVVCDQRDLISWRNDEKYLIIFYFLYMFMFFGFFSRRRATSSSYGRGGGNFLMKAASQKRWKCNPNSNYSNCFCSCFPKGVQSTSFFLRGLINKYEKQSTNARPCSFVRQSGSKTTHPPTPLL